MRDVKLLMRIAYAPSPLAFNGILLFPHEMSSEDIGCVKQAFVDAQSALAMPNSMPLSEAAHENEGFPR